MNKLKVERLSNHHNKKNFDCGVIELNHYLQTMASQHAKKGVSRTFVLVEESNSNCILGFVTLTACEIESEMLPAPYSKKYPSKIPGAKIGRLAISEKFQRQGFGEQLMVFAMHQAIIVHETLGLAGMLVDAKDKHALKYYEKYGFLSLLELPLTLFLPIKSILNAFDS
ncbi:MAG: GNAT family N-acetyltransferase [SAR324 cluster bacterium]|nr:GNAT family N-acetyltransferase [SAR324 cluster bacterium]